MGTGQDGGGSPTHQHHSTLGRDLLDHLLGDMDQAGLLHRSERLGGRGGEDLLARCRERPDDPLEKPGCGLLLVGHLFGCQPCARGHPVDEIVVHQRPPEALGHEPCHGTPAGAELSADGDEHRYLSIRGARARANNATSPHAVPPAT